jgi:beta-glucosidase-like glycosyl hydrolase
MISLFLCSSVHAKSNVPSDLEMLCASMSIDQKIGQLFMVASVSDVDLNPNYHKSVYTLNPDYVEDLITNYYVGGVIFIGAGSRESQKYMCARFQQAASLPLLMALDAEWGSAMRLLDGYGCEKNKMLARRSQQDITTIAKKIGQELKDLGLHINCAPVVDVNTNPNNPVIGARSFGCVPELVAEKAIAYMEGLHQAGIMACAKHFPGHGDTTVDSHLSLPLVEHNKQRLQEVELYPFVRMIEQGVPIIMVGHLAVPAYDASGCAASVSRAIVHDLLRKQLMFDGIIMTDGLGMQALANFGEPGELECAAICAGNDMVLCPLDVPEAIACIKQAILDDRLSLQELDEHVMRILLAKRRAGLL